MDWICQPNCGCFSRDLGDKIEIVEKTSQIGRINKKISGHVAKW